MTTPAAYDLAALTHALGAAACRFDIDLLPRCDSTNAVLLARAEAGAPSGSVVVTEEQTAGRGRRGRAWLSTPGDSLTFSLLWRFTPGTSPAGLSLATGLALAQALENLLPDPADTASSVAERAADLSGKVGTGNTASFGIRLKWPNDILLDGKKLGGILVELVPGTPYAAVIGIGINRRLPAALPEDVQAQAAALGDAIDNTVLLATILARLLAVLEDFSAAGFAALREDWQARHAFQNQPVRLLSDFSPPRVGVCRGVAADGALLLELDGRLERILSGEISLRAAT